MPQPNIEELMAEYRNKLGFNADPKKIQQMHFRKLYAASLNLSRANVHPEEPCVIATTTTDEDAIFNPDATVPKLRQCLGWHAARCIANGNFRLATPEENDRYFVEVKEREEICRKAEAAKPEKLQAEIQRIEAQNTRETIRELVGALTARSEPGSEPETPGRGPVRPAKNAGEKEK